MRCGSARGADRLEDGDGRVGEEDCGRGEVETLLKASGRGLREARLIGRQGERVDEVVHALEDLHARLEPLALTAHLLEREERRYGRG